MVVVAVVVVVVVVVVAAAAAVVVVLVVVVWVAGTLSTVTQTDPLVKICMNGSRSRGIGYRVLLY